MSPQSPPPGYPSAEHPPPGYPPQGHPPPGYPPQGYPPPKTGMPGWAILLIVGGIVLAVVGVLAAVAIPAFMKYKKRARATEAAPNLKKIFDGAKGYYEKGPVREGSELDVVLQFPGTVGITPQKPCCGQKGDKCRGSSWSHPTWQALDFKISDPHYFQYRFSSTGEGRSARFTAGAHADLDCDSVLSTWERTGTVDIQNRVIGAASIYQNQPYE